MRFKGHPSRWGGTERGKKGEDRELHLHLQLLDGRVDCSTFGFIALVVQREVQLQLQLLDGRDESTFRSIAGAPDAPNCYVAEKSAKPEIKREE